MKPDPPEILVDPRLHERPVELVVTARLTVPVNPLIGAIVIFEVPEELTFVDTLAGFADIEKSRT